MIADVQLKSLQPCPKEKCTSHDDAEHTGLEFLSIDAVSMELLMALLSHERADLTR